MPWMGEAARAGGPCRNPKGPQTNVPLVDMLDSLPAKEREGRVGVWQSYPEAQCPPFSSWASQPPAGMGSREGQVQRSGWGRGGG